MTAADGVFSRILCATDGSHGAEAAVRQALRLAPSHSKVTVVSVAALAAAAHPEILGAISARAHDALRAAREIAGPRKIETLELKGDPAGALLESASHGATLVAVGAHSGRRVGGILIGSVATALIHRCGCSTLVARPAAIPAGWPQRVIVGLDGSASSRRATEVSRDVAERLQRPLEIVVARGAQVPVLGDPAPSGSEVRRDERDPVTALSERASGEDLVVVGSRGLRGVRALGSVGEQVAHRASGSVLIVRAP
jgi:nucleotide-binding universal stress UspA family protein